MTTAKSFLINARSCTIIIPEITFNCKILDKIVVSSGLRRRIELCVWNGNDAQAIIRRSRERRRWHIIAGARLVRCHDVRRRSMLPAVSRHRPSHPRIQNLIVVVVIW